MSRLNLRENTLLYNTNSEPDWASAYRVTALPIGAMASASSSGTTATVHRGHGFRAGQKFCTINTATAAVVLYGSVTAVTGTTLTLNTSHTIASDDILINLGADTGSAAPNYDGSPVAVWTTSDKTTKATSSTVTADSVGKYRYWHQGHNFWELVRDSLLRPVDVIPGIGLCAIAGGVNAVDFGARPDDITIDSGPAILAAADAIRSLTAHPTSGAAAQMGGTVWLPVDDVGSYGIGTSVNVKYGVSIEGLGGWARLVCITTGLDYMLGVDSHNGVIGARNSGFRRIMLDGASKADIGFYIGLAVLNTFQDLRSQNCTDAGCVLDGSQNNVFINCDFSSNGALSSTNGCGLRLENAAGLNTFIMGQIRNNTPYNLRVREMATQSTYSAFFYGNGASFGGDGPTGNTFYRTIIEELDSTATASVLFTSGRDNRFIGGSFSIDVDLPMVQLRDTDASGTVNAPNRNGFLACTMKGQSSTGGDCFQIDDATRTMIDNNVFQNFDNLINWGAFTPGNGQANNVVQWGTGNYIVGSSVADYFDVGATGFNLEICLAGGQSHGTLNFYPETSSLAAFRVGTEAAGTQTTNFRMRGSGQMLWGTGSDAGMLRAGAGVMQITDRIASGATTGITASVTQTQAGGTALTTGVNNVGTVANANDTCTLPLILSAGEQIVVINNGAQTMRLYPGVGDNCGTGVDTFITIAAANMWTAVSYDTTNWRGVTAAFDTA